MAKGENIYKRKDGRWEGRYPKGRKIDGSLYYGYVYAKSYRTVKERLTEKRAAVRFVSNIKDKEFLGTFAEWSEIWLNEYLINHIKESTYAGYRNKLVLHILPEIGSKKLKRITSEDIQLMVNHLSTELSSSTVHVIFRIVKSSFQLAREKGFIFFNPCERIRLPKVAKNKVKALSKEQQANIERISLQSKKGLPILLALETGMRISEICGLKWQDIDFDNAVLHVRRIKHRIPATDPNKAQTTQLIETEPKTNSAIRMIPLSNKIQSLLLKEKEISISPYVISHGTSSVEPRTISYRFEQIKLSLGYTEMTFHSLRHTFATRCIEAGVNVAAVSGLLGHSSIKLTLDTYTTSFIDEQRIAIEKVSAR